MPSHASAKLDVLEVFLLAGPAPQDLSANSDVDCSGSQSNMSNVSSARSDSLSSEALDNFELKSQDVLSFPDVTLALVAQRAELAIGQATSCLEWGHDGQWCSLDEESICSAMRFALDEAGGNGALQVRATAATLEEGDSQTEEQIDEFSKILVREDPSSSRKLCSTSPHKGRKRGARTARNL